MYPHYRREIWQAEWDGQRRVGSVARNGNTIGSVPSKQLNRGNCPYVRYANRRKKMRLPSENDIRFPDPVESGMSMSEDIDQIATALHGAISLLHNAPKTTKGYGYKYAPLDEVLDIIRPAFMANGLFFMQTPWTPSEGEMGVTTLVTHTSGQWISSQFAIKIETQKGMNYNQSCGTLLTYMRRYSAISFACLAMVEDSDGEGKKEKEPKEKKSVEELAKPNPITKDAVDELKEIAKEKGRDALEVAWKSLDRGIKEAITSGEKAALKQVASNAHPS